MTYLRPRFIKLDPTNSIGRTTCDAWVEVDLSSWIGTEKTLVAVRILNNDSGTTKTFKVKGEDDIASSTLSAAYLEDAHFVLVTSLLGKIWVYATSTGACNWFVSIRGFLNIEYYVT